MSSCPSFEELNALVDGGLIHDRELDVRCHLDGCETCRRGAGAVTTLKRIMGAAYVNQGPPPELRRAVMAQRPM